MPIASTILDIAEAIKKQISERAIGQGASGTASPQAQAPQQLTPEPPPDIDYTEGMQRPELTKLASNMEFKATPSRATAMLVALGNILQDKRNLEATKQGIQQKEYDTKLTDALDLNKARKGMSMKREFDESDPDTQLKREAFQTEQEHKKKMYPLEEKKAQAYIDKLLKGGSGGRSGSVGGSSYSQTPEGTLYSEIYDEAFNLIASNQNNPLFKNRTHEDVMKDIINDRISQNKKNPDYRIALTRVAKQIDDETKPEKTIKKSPVDETYQFYRDQGDPPPLALEKTKQHGFKPEKSLDRLEEESVARERGAIRAYMEPITPSPAPTVPTPSSKVEEYKKRRGLK